MTTGSVENLGASRKLPAYARGLLIMGGCFLLFGGVVATLVVIKFFRMKRAPLSNIIAV